MATYSLAISKEETRENTAFGTLPTADLIKEVVVGESGLLRVGYSARFKSSVAEAGKAAIFIGANQLKLFSNEAKVVSASTVSTTFHQLSSSKISGLSANTSVVATGTDVTTGQLLSSGLDGGSAEFWLTPGTYEVSVQFKATSGSVTAKERRLFIEAPE